MNLDTFTLSNTMMGRLSSASAGVLQPFRVGYDPTNLVLPADTDQYMSLDVVLTASGAKTLHIDDFHVDAGAAGTNLDGNTVNIVTLYAMLVYQISSLLGLTASAITLLLTETGTTQGGTLRVMAFGKSS